MHMADPAAASVPLDDHHSSFLINPNNNNNNNNITTSSNIIEKEEEEEECCCHYKETYKKHKEIVQSFPKEKASWMAEDTEYVNYQGAWFSIPILLSVMLLQKHYDPHYPSSDTTTATATTLLSTFPKAGTTWYKSLLFSILNRTRFPAHSPIHPLLSTPPHDLVPFLEQQQQRQQLCNAKLTNPPKTSSSSVEDQKARIFNKHIPYHLLPASVRNTGNTGGGGCRIVYVFRNPKDVLTSSWHFFNKHRPKQLPPLSLQQAFDLFTESLHPYGPFWDHALGYWNAHLESPDKVLFLTYEETKKEPSACIKKIAEFLGQPITKEEEESRAESVVEEIVKLCSIENLRNLKVNNNGVLNFSKEIVIKNNDFYREGRVGDWEKHLTKEMIECLDHITLDKFGGAPGLIHHINSHL